MRKQRSDCGYGRKSMELAGQLTHLMDAPVAELEWPTDLFGTIQDNHIIAADDKCGWKGCNRPHGHNLPLPVRNPYGEGFSRNLYFCCEGHRTLYIRSAANG